MASGKTRHLVIVESPRKAETLSKVLGKDYDVEATVGHVVDLPKKGLAVDVDNGFEPEYVTVRGKAKMISDLKRRAKNADEILIATDPDREGEAIGFHIAEKLGYREDDGERFHRVRFNEFTKDAVLAAIAKSGDIDLRQVDAQQARRILDRLVGYGLSPLLWKKISPVDPVSRRPLSAGRVQSVAVRLLVERERERRRFHAASWWDILATLSADGAEFPARLARIGGKRVVTGNDFDSTTGLRKKGSAAVALEEEEARQLAAELGGEEFVVASVTSKDFPLKPYAPFRTSTLQQEASRRLNLSPRDTMSLAQRLYEAGHITYMRTDSVRLSSEAIGAARGRIEEKYGKEYLSPGPRNFGKQAKGAQEAHEAIRPAGNRMRTASELALSGREAALYDLIWKRMMATQMAEAKRRSVKATLRAGETEFEASGTTTIFPGFLRVMAEGKGDPAEALGERDKLLPPLEKDQVVEQVELEAKGHSTRPPARFDESSLIEALEKAGVGRPSTYASTVGTIQERGYVDRDGKQLVPTYLAFAVTRLLEEHFSDLVDPGFTSDMETDLDRIADGELQWQEFLEDFYRGPDGFETRLEEREESIDPRTASTLSEFEDIRPTVRIGRYGPYLELNEQEEPIRVTLPEGLAPADLTAEKAEELIEAKEKADQPLGHDEATGLPVRLLIGRYGPFVQLGEQEEGGEKPKRASLPKGMTPEDVDLATALGLLSLPRVLGPHPDGGDVLAGIGRYGPFVVHEGDYRSLQEGDEVLAVTLDRALELLAEPKKGRRRAAPKVLRELGEHPADGEPVRILDGRYGPYVKHGKTNASLPKDLPPEQVDMERAVELIAERQARGPAKRKGSGRGGRKKKG
ncbi:MAG: type I DNA topoisomerase [marine benthic group bacterium]|jgi:DNA topoisomerase-1|nr:type I DNA topoisomerase [Gemmatimonadota bacterium]MCL7962428.1 type I DNA topoisomerase [Candidatus Carthagonibacter metallireducens]MCL7986194.1 type I DNA topoisomerase [Gemmatimonadota bacterium]